MYVHTKQFIRVFLAILNWGSSMVCVVYYAWPMLLMLIFWLEIWPIFTKKGCATIKQRKSVPIRCWKASFSLTRYCHFVSGMLCPMACPQQCGMVLVFSYPPQTYFTWLCNCYITVRPKFIYLQSSYSYIFFFIFLHLKDSTVIQVLRTFKDKH